MDFITRLLAAIGLWKPRRTSFGYSAEIWRRASHSVYRPIGEPRKLSISPPTESGQLPKEASSPLELAYFNLHGLEDTADWYGQRDPLEHYDGPDYPVALSPKDIINSGRAPQVVFSEACFGANIFGKTTETALALTVAALFFWLRLRRASPCLTLCVVSPYVARGGNWISHYIVVSRPSGGVGGRESVSFRALRTWRARAEPCVTPVRR